MIIPRELVISEGGVWLPIALEEVTYNSPARYVNYGVLGGIRMVFDGDRVTIKVGEVLSPLVSWDDMPRHEWREVTYVNIRPYHQEGFVIVDLEGD